jgi:hypothetical protein
MPTSKGNESPRLTDSQRTLLQLAHVSSILLRYDEPRLRTAFSAYEGLEQDGYVSLVHVSPGKLHVRLTPKGKEAISYAC